MLYHPSGQHANVNRGLLEKDFWIQRIHSRDRDLGHHSGSSLCISTSSAGCSWQLHPISPSCADSWRPRELHWQHRPRQAGRGGHVVQPSPSLLVWEESLYLSSRSKTLMLLSYNPFPFPPLGDFNLITWFCLSHFCEWRTWPEESQSCQPLNCGVMKSIPAASGFFFFNVRNNLCVKLDHFTLPAKAFLTNIHTFQNKPRFIFLALILLRRLNWGSNTTRRQTKSKSHTTVFGYIISKHCVFTSGYFKRKC